MANEKTEPTLLSYEAKVARVEAILKQLENSQMPIDELGRGVKESIGLLTEANAKLCAVETEVMDAFKELEREWPKPA